MSKKFKYNSFSYKKVNDRLLLNNNKPYYASKLEASK